MRLQPYAGNVTRRRMLAGIWTLALLVLGSLLPHAALAVVDSHTLLAVHFDGTMYGEQGEFPDPSTGVSFEPGILGSGAYFAPGNQVFYPSSGNINPLEGTLEFWVKPRWKSSDAPLHSLLLLWDGSRGFWFYQRQNYLVLHAYSGAGQPIISVFAPASDWQPNQWHHVAFTWSNAAKKLTCYIDGQLSTQTPFTLNLQVPNASYVQMGGQGPGDSLDGVLDELQISDVARGAPEIARSFIAGLTTITNPTLRVITAELYETWQLTPSLIATTNLGVGTLPPAGASWTSSNPAVAVVDENGNVKALSAGTTTITATLNGVTTSVQIRVKAPVLPPVHEALDPYLTTPPPDALYVVPVVIVRYLATEDGRNLDVTYDPGYFTLDRITLDQAKGIIDTLDRRAKFMLEEGSRFHGYKDPAARPSIGYRVVDYITIYEPTPPAKLGIAQRAGGGTAYRPDYLSMMARLNAAHYVNDLGVKEFWIWIGGVDTGFPAYNPAIHPPEKLRFQPESNMSSPVTGDVSNGGGDSPDLPIFNSTYTVYGNHFRSSGGGPGHIHGHQLERLLGFANQQQDGNTSLFWKQFVGQDTSGNPITGRAGWTHMPPNTRVDYDYANMTLVDSDIEDWTPGRIGQTKRVNALTWAGIPFRWPQATSDVQNYWYTYWMQNMPGLGNTIANGLGQMTNWWDFTADWDASVRAGLGLYTAAPCNPVISPTSSAVSADGGFGSVNVTPVACPWISVSNAPWMQILPSSIGSSNVSQVLFNIAPNPSPNARTGTLAVAGQTFTVTQAGRP